MLRTSQVIVPPFSDYFWRSREWHRPQLIEPPPITKAWKEPVPMITLGAGDDAYLYSSELVLLENVALRSFVTEYHETTFAYKVYWPPVKTHRAEVWAGPSRAQTRYLGVLPVRSDGVVRGRVRTNIGDRIYLSYRMETT